MSVEEKKCSKCGIIKNKSEFYISKILKSGLTSQCKSCLLEYNKSEPHQKKQKEYYQKNKSKIILKQAEYFKRTKKDRIKTLEKYREQNKEKISKKRKIYNEKNKEKISLYKKMKYEQNKDHNKQQRKIKYDLNKEKILKQKKRYSDSHKKEKSIYDKIYREKNKEQKALNGKIYYEKNKENHIKRSNNYTRQRRQTDLSFKILGNLRNRCFCAINKRYGITNSKKTLDLLGCSIDEVREHLELLFVDGMSWENYGIHGWHIDHIIPCNYFDLTDPEQQKRCFNYKNLQPMWAKDNIKKGTKILLI